MIPDASARFCGRTFFVPDGGWAEWMRGWGRIAEDGAVWAVDNKKRRRASQLAGVAILKSYLKLQCVFIMKTNIIVSDAYPFGGVARPVVCLVWSGVSSRGR